MKLSYQTGIATLVQFVCLTLLNIASAGDSIVTTCHRTSSNCVSNAIPSIIYFILIALFFAAVWLLGWAAQEFRSRRLAYLLIATELIIIFAAVFNIHHHNNALSVATSGLDIGLALWVILLAWRLGRARGGRVVRPTSGRRRQLPKNLL